jgi:hypothetical protein
LKIMTRNTNLGRRSYSGGLLAIGCAGALFLLSGKAAKAQSPSSSPNQDHSSAQSSTQSNAKPNLAGTWKLNKDQSDDPRQKMREAMGSPSGEPGGQGGSSGRSQQPGAGRPGRGNGPGGGMMAEWSELTIEQTNTNAKVTGALGRVLATNETQSTTQSNSGENGGMRFPPETAEWQGSQLVTKGHGFGGGTTTRTFELSPDGKQLNVTTKIENERFSQPVTYKLVYDRGKAEGNNQ